MKDKVRLIQYGEKQVHAINCPACKHIHIIAVDFAFKNGAQWTFNCNFQKPTFGPSIKLTSPGYCCHFFVKEGEIKYCNDCTHILAGKTVPLPEFENISEGKKPKQVKQKANPLKKHTMTKLTEKQIEKVAKEHNLETALVKSVIKVESSGSGFLKDGRPKILFEGHIFYNNLKKAGINPNPLTKKHPSIVYAKWTREHYKGGSKEYTRLDQAKLIHKSSALKSTSWGLFQIMGFNHQLCGYTDVKSFVIAQKESE